MNIKITHNWLLDYLDTDANPDEMQKYLSLCGPSIEKVEKVEDDYVYDIEVTSNRIDVASVLGVAQESQAILPQFKKKASLKENPLEKYKFSAIKAVETLHEASLQIKIKDLKLCSRFTAIVLDNVKIKRSPDFIRERLNLCSIKTINNVVDISNYLMIVLGQPVHIFDYYKIGKGMMTMRESQKGEKIVTLDGKNIILPGKDIVIEDGSGNLIDLCGIMGGLNSSVTDKTKTIVLFVQTYNTQMIRKTSMLTGQRTVAASYFEKGLDEERVEPTTAYGIELLQKYVDANISSKVYDIYPNPFKAKSVSISFSDIRSIIGIEIKKEKIINILSSLGFKHHINTDRSTMVLEIPSWRRKDISIKEDIVEEIARIYGYHNLPNKIQSSVYINQPKNIELLFELQAKVKHYLKNIGLNEVMNYSMISSEMIENLALKTGDYLRVKNSVSEEIEFMRKHICLSLIKNSKENEGKKDILNLFEIAKGYVPQAGNLPIEKYQLAIATNTSLTDLKGIIDALFAELNITEYKITQSEYSIFKKGLQAKITIANDWLGKFGQINRSVIEKFDLKSEVFLASFEFETLMKYYQSIGTFKPIHPYSQIKLDLTLEQDPKRSFLSIKDIAFRTSKLLQKLKLIDIFKNKFTLRLFFSSNKRNITEDEAKKELKNIKEAALELN